MHQISLLGKTRLVNNGAFIVMCVFSFDFEVHNLRQLRVMGRMRRVSMPCGLTLADQCVKLYYKVGSVKTFMKMCGSDAYCYEKTNPFL